MVKRAGEAVNTGCRSTKSPKNLASKGQREQKAARQRELKKQHQLMQTNDFGSSFNTVSYNDI